MSEKSLLLLKIITVFDLSLFELNEMGALLDAMFWEKIKENGGVKN